MCCFSRPVSTVADTNIFARAVKGRQYLVYSMKFSSGEDLAMILPIPTPKGSPEDAVKFLNLEKYADFFVDMKKGFPDPPAPRGPKPGASLSLGEKKALVVVEVGDFVASFVPAIKDFDRLDKQFRLPEGVWEKLPLYKNFGFAVFKLKKPEMKDGQKKVHPMAFEFPQADKELLFFPTVHIHDGSAPAKAKFDHALYCQGEAPRGWDESPGHPSSFMKVGETQGIVSPNEHVYRKLMKGTFANKDIVV